MQETTIKIKNRLKKKKIYKLLVNKIIHKINFNQPKLMNIKVNKSKNSKAYNCINFKMKVKLKLNFIKKRILQNNSMYNKTIIHIIKIVGKN